MQIQKLFTLGEKEKEKEKNFEKFDKKLSTKLAAAANAKSWSDLLPIIKDIYSHLKVNFEYDFNNISDKLLLGKRLAQVLNPECPSGLHDVTLDVYEILLRNIITTYKDKLMDNLHIYCYGLFPFFPNANIANKQKFLEKIVKGIFYKLNNIELKLCLPGLLSSLIPGLDDNNEETTKNIYSTLDELARKDEHNFFGVYWMLLLRCKHLRNSGIKYLLEKVIKYDDIKSQDETTRIGTIEKYFPNINTTVVNALREIIKETDIPVVRNGMDFIMTRLPLTKDNTMITDEAKINLINSALNLFVKNDYSTIRRLKSWILGLKNQDDDVDYNSDDMKYKMGLVITAFKNIFKSEKNLDKDVIKNNISIFERFLDSDEEFVNKILSSTAFPALKSVVNYWEKNLDSSEEAMNEPIISQITKFFNKNEKYFECLWESLASSIIINPDQLKNIDDIISPLKFCLIYIYIETNEKRIKYYIPIITKILSQIKQIPLKREEFKYLKKVVMITLAYTKTLQETKFQEKNEETEEEDVLSNFKNSKGSSNSEVLKLTGKDNLPFIATPSMRKSALNELINEDKDNEVEEVCLTDVYEISDELNLKSLLAYDKNLVENLSANIVQYQEYYIGILNEFLSTGKEENKSNQITRFEIGFFRQIAELTIRLQEYNQTEQNEIPKWIKYLEKIIFNYSDYNTDNILSIEAANILLDLNLSFSKNEKDSVYTKIKKNFCSEDIDTQIIDKGSLDNIIQKVDVKTNCFELLFAKFYLLSNKQSQMNNIMEILQKIFYFDKNKFNDIIDNTFNTSEKLDENIKLFSNFWKSVNEYYPDEKIFKADTIFKMLDLLEDEDPTLRHLSKTWLNQANQQFNKIIDPILLEFLDQTILFNVIDDVNGEQSEFIREFKTTKLLKALKKLKNIIINSQIMNFLKQDLKKEILTLIRFSKYSKIKMSYLQTLICTVLHYIRTSAKVDLSKEFAKDVFSLNVASTEFLEFLLKNINDYEFLIKNTSLINETILEMLMKSLKKENEVMAVQLLDVLRTLYFNYPPEIIKSQMNKSSYINLLMNSDLEKIIKEGIVFDHFYIRDHFISFTKKLVETFFNSISIEDKEALKAFYNLCNRFIEPLASLLTKKVKLENIIKMDTEKFSHYDGKNNKIIYKNYCEEYKEYKTYDESEVLSILNGINDIISQCFTNQIQEKNKEMSTDKGIKLFAIPISFIKKKTKFKTDFKGNWQEHKKKLADDLKTNNAFVSFFTTQVFDFVDENPNQEIKDMSSNLYHNQIYNLLNSFLSIWINQSDKYQKYDYCLNPNGILIPIKVDYFLNRSNNKFTQAKENLKNNPIKSVIISIAKSLFVTDSIKFIENIMNLWSQEQKSDDKSEFKNKDKQYKLSIIELLTALDIPTDVILFCVGVYLQKMFANNTRQKKYTKSKPDKCYITPLDVSIREAKIFHFIYSYILLNPNTYLKKTLVDRNEILEIWKEIINIITNSMNETKILNSFCWLYEIMQLTSQKFPLYDIDSRDIKNGIENIFNFVNSKLMDAVFNQKLDSKYINDSKLTLPFLPHVYTNIINEIYKEDNLYHKNLEGGKSSNSGFNPKSLKSKVTSDNLDRRATFGRSGITEETITYTLGAKSISQSLVIINKNETPKQEEIETSINKFYENFIKLPKTHDESEMPLKSSNNDDIIDKKKLNSYYQFLAFITLKENFYPLIKALFQDNIKVVSKYYNEIISKLLQIIKQVESGHIYCEFAHKFLEDLMEKSPTNVSTCGKDVLIEYINTPKLFKSTASELHEWKNIIKLFAKNYKDILKDLINDMNDKNIFVKKTEEEKSKTLRRVSFVIYSCGRDDFSANFALIKSKAKELLSDFSTNNNLEKEIFLLLRMLFLRFSHDAVMQMIRDLWPIIFTELVKNIISYKDKNQKNNFTSVIESFKFIELLSLVNIEEFSLYQWIFLFDTFDVKDCDIKNKSLSKELLLDGNNLFKPLTFEIIKDDVSNLNDEVLEGKKKAKNELIIDAEKEGKFRKQLYEFYYSIGDMNSFKIEANYNQIAENIEKDFIDKNKEKSTKKENKK